MKVIQTYYDCSMVKAEEYYKILTAKEIGIMKERMKKRWEKVNELRPLQNGRGRVKTTG